MKTRTVKLELSEAQHDLLVELMKSGVTDEYGDVAGGRTLVGPEFVAVIRPQLDADMKAARSRLALVRENHAFTKYQRDSAENRVEHLELVADHLAIYEQLTRDA